jgi:outer membrane protein OmpA-like peptidoglycan-associated protein
MSARPLPTFVAALVGALALMVMAASPGRADAVTPGTDATPRPPAAVRRELDRAQELLLVQLASLPQDSGVLVLRDPERVVLRIPARVMFDFDSAVLKQDPAAAAAAALAASRQLLRKHPRLQAQIVVYTDSIGGASANQSLSDQRAQAVYTALTGAGVAPGRLSQLGAGATAAVASDATPQGRIENRRVEIGFWRAGSGAAEIKPAPAAAP